VLGLGFASSRKGATPETDFEYAECSEVGQLTDTGMADADEIRRGIEIRRPKKKRSIQNHVRIKSCVEIRQRRLLPAAVSAGS